MKKVKEIFNSILGFIRRNERIILYCLAALLILWVLSLKTCNKNSPYANQQSTIDSLTLANQKMETIVNEKNQEVKVQTAIVVRNQETIDKYADEIFALKKKNSKNTHTTGIVSQVTETGVDSVEVAYVDTVAFKKFSDSVNKKCAEVIAYMKESTITIPRTVEDSTKDFIFKGEVTKTGFNINKISFPDSTSVRFVTHKGGLFKRNSLGKVKLWTKKSIEAQVVHSNPYVKVTNMNSVFFVPEVKQRWLERILIAAASVLITTQILK